MQHPAVRACDGEAGHLAEVVDPDDVEMLEVAGIGVAMGNAPAEVQAIASWVAPSVEFDGVAAAIEKFVL